MHSRLIDPAAIARQADLDAMNIEIYHFASGEARQLRDKGFAAFCYLPAGHHEKLMQYGINVEAQVIQESATGSSTSFSEMMSHRLQG